MAHRFWYIWLIIFLSFLILGGIFGFVFMYFLNPQSEVAAQPRVQVHSRIVTEIPVQNKPAHQDEPALTAENPVLKNPFIVPPFYQHNISPRPKNQKRNLLEYRGIIETNDSIMGLVTVSSSGESLVVYEGEELVELGVVIDKISAKTLTYSKNGIKTVISLGGIQH